MTDTFIPVNEPLFAGNEKAYLAECIDSGWISSEGPFVARFEQSFAAACGRRHGIAVTNGTTALEAAVVALGIGAGDEVILPTLTIVSCVGAVVRAGAVPVVVDCRPDTWCMDVAAIEARITPRTKAIMAVHLYGLAVDMDPLLEIAARHGLMVIEDAAEAIGLAYRGRPCGSFGTLSTVSFYPNKHVTTGEGGMILTDDDALAERCRSLRNLCFQPQQRFLHEELGWNLRMSSLQAAVGLAQLERLAETSARKRAIGLRYTERLAGLPGLKLPPTATADAENCYWVYAVELDDSVPFDAKEASRRLGERKVASRPFFWCLHEQPVLKRMGLFADDRHPVAERGARRGLLLPSGVALTDSQIDAVAERLRAVLAG
ncbi:MAG: DegT/DnrJ/EryC1/StrS family aminotransferase [Magnetospirillum sp.]|nr:DegT/DnrJ/EryC1/StrS family aminotransferase [Magnetospirillum sp.]